MLMLNQKITSHEAYERNLVTQVFPDSEFDQKVAEVVKYMTSLPPQVPERVQSALCHPPQAIHPGCCCYLFLHLSSCF